MAGFGDFGANPNATGVSYDELYDRLHLIRVTHKTIYDRFGQARFIPAKSGVKQMFAMRYKNVAPATTPLTEGVLPQASNILRERVSFSVAQYGAFTKYTDQLDVFDVDNIKTEFTNILGDQAALTSDVIVRDVINGGSNVIYAQGAVSRLALADAHVASAATSLVVANDLKLAVLKLKNAGAEKYTEIMGGSAKISTQPVRDGYYAFVHPNVVEDLRNITGFINAENYAYTEKLAPNEIGAYGDIRFIENNNAKQFVQIATDTNEYNIYSILVVAKDAYANVSVRGKQGTEMIHKPITSGGTDNALNQIGSIGWKMYCGAAILNDAFMVRIECTASNDLNTIIGGIETNVRAV